MSHYTRPAQHRQACLLTCVERRSRLLLTTTMTDKSADTTAQALSGLLEKIPKKAGKTVTLYNGGAVEV